MPTAVIAPEWADSAAATVLGVDGEARGWHVSDRVIVRGAPRDVYHREWDCRPPGACHVDRLAAETR